MNKKDLIKEVANRTDLSIHLSKIIMDCLVKNISTALKQGERVSLRDFGAFCNVEKQSKRYYDIHTGKIRNSPSKRVVKFVPYKKFKERLAPLKVLDVHKENDGSIGDFVTAEKFVYSISQHYQRVKGENKTHAKSIIGRKNTGQRINRDREENNISLSFDGYFLFDHFLGESEHKEFPSLKVPTKNAPVLKPHVNKIGTTVGVMEPILLEYLINMCREIDGIKVLENVKFPILNRNYSYRPDFCLYWKKKNLYIDIEIDEPYDIVSRKPIHYQNNGDNLRDRYFIRNGWCVIRFAEQQVKENIKGVINYVRRVLRWLTDENGIKIHKDTLATIDRWSYEEAAEMSSSNVREHYLVLPDYVPPTPPESPIQESKTPIFVKPKEDILPEMAPSQNESKWRTVIDEIKQSKCEHCILTRTNGYQWVYICKSLDIQSINGIPYIKGQSPLGIDIHFPLDEIERLVPLEELFSNDHWKCKSSTTLEDLISLKEILFNAIANGKPIWVAYDSNNSGYSTRFLSNIATNRTTNYFAPHIGLGNCKKYGIHSLSHFHAYCSYRKEFRCFAADWRIKDLKVLNCDHVYLIDEEYANSFAKIVMHPYEFNNGNAFFENADEILRIMPQNELKSTFVQGNLANLQVMKGEIDKAIMTYKKFPFDYFITPSLIWGEACISDIHFFINMCKEHLNDSHFYEGLDANILLHNFEEVLKLLTQSSWMHDYN